jgi:hypothetical protein
MSPRAAAFALSANAVARAGFVWLGAQWATFIGGCVYMKPIDPSSTALKADAEL